ncbi:MAG TPA: NAD(P)H-binding protein [Candidatus Eisenbacteria bacterium]|nr:NAD(P)H-binding protein [Candidatus Eisenbacteria bacterium]
MVTGAFSFTGRFIARELIARGWSVRTLTNSRYPGDPLALQVAAHPLGFSRREELVTCMRGADLFVNTYWIRYPHAGMTFETAVDNTRVLLDAAVRAQVGGVVHIGVVSAAPDSPHPYLVWKWRADEVVRASGLPHAIVQPTLIFGDGDVLITNHAWLLRRLPVFLVAGDGGYEVQPVAGEDVARVTADIAEGPLEGSIVDVGGSERYTYLEFVRLIHDAIDSRSQIVCLPGPAVMSAAWMLGKVIGDTIVTNDEMAALRAGTLASPHPPLGTMRLADWLHEHAETVGRRYVRRQTRHGAPR